MNKRSQQWVPPKVPCAQNFTPEFDIATLPDLRGFVRSRLRAAGITTLRDLTNLSEAELGDVDGVGPTTVKYLLFVLNQNGMTFKEHA